MKAVVLHGPDDLRVETVPDATLPPGGVLIAPRVVGICGSDVRTWRHGSPRLRGPQVPGHESAGVVVASDAEGFAAGDRVAVCPGAPCGACRWCAAGQGNLCPTRRVLGYDLPGGMAELEAVPDAWIRAGGLVHLDPAAPIEAGAFVEPLHTVINGQDELRIQAGEQVLVLGLGPIGILHAAFAFSAGARVIGLDPSPDRVGRARAILDPGIEVAPLDAATDRPDVVIVAVGRRDAVADAVARVRPGGRVLAFAGLPPDTRVLGIDMNDLHYRQLTLVGAFGGTPGTFRRAAAWLAANPLDPDALAPERHPLEDAPAAFAAAESGRGLRTLLTLPG